MGTMETWDWIVTRALRELLDAETPEAERAAEDRLIEIRKVAEQRAADGLLLSRVFGGEP